MEGWYDTEDFTPVVRALVELPSGEQLWAKFACGSWETDQGQVVYPVQFREPGVVVVVGLYKAPFDIE